MLLIDPAKLGLTTSLGYVWDPILLDYVVATPAIGGGGGGGAVTIANGADLATGSTLDLEAAAGTGSVIAILKRIRTLLSNPLAVTGAFFQATQPVSIAAAVPVTDNAGSLTVDTAQLPAALTGAGNLKVSIAEDGGAVIGVDDNGGSLTVDGAVDITDRPARALGIIASITAALDISDRVGRALGVIASITAAVDIGDRAARILGIERQQRDQARVWKSIRFTSAAAAAADTILSATLNTDGVDAGAGATTFAVTAGKKFRVTGVTLHVRTTTAATPWGLLSLRVNPAGAAVIGSPVVHWLAVGGTAAVIGNVAADTLIFPEGWELSGTMQLALTFANNVATNVTNIVVHGYEYTP